MKTKLCTSIDQSKHLLSLGLDPDTADMYWETYDTKDCPYTLGVGEHVSIKENLFSFRLGYVFPAWSLSALIELMPMMELRKFGGKYTIYEKDYGSTAFLYENPIDAAYEYMCYLLRQGLIKNDKV